MGMVFKGMQTSMDRPIALKTLHPKLAMAPTFFERFKREAEIASRLKHPNIIHLREVYRRRGRLVLSTDSPMRTKPSAS
jgi:serine/threonine-protein kinase